MIRLHTHLKRMIVKASTMGWTIEDVQKRIDVILEKYGVRNKLPDKELMTKREIALVFAYRKIMFYTDIPWGQINFLGSFTYSNIRIALKKGWVFNKFSYKSKNKTYWVVPSKEFWETEVKPLVENRSAKELEDEIFGSTNSSALIPDF